MEEKKKGMLDVLAADEIHRYMKARRAVNDDTELSAMVNEYEEGSAEGAASGQRRYGAVRHG